MSFHRILLQKIGLSLLLSLLTVVSLRGQVIEPSIIAPSLHVGGSLGATLSQIAFMPRVPQKQIFGCTSGISASVENSPYTAISVELNYALRGWSEQFSAPRTELAYSRRMHFIEMPLLCQLFYPIGMVRLGIKMGPQVGYMLGEKSWTQGSGFTEREMTRHETLASHRLAWGLVGGPLLAFSFGKNRIELEGRFYYGFNDIFNTTVSDPYSKASEMSVVVKLSYLYQLF